MFKSIIHNVSKVPPQLSWKPSHQVLTDLSGGFTRLNKADKSQQFDFLLSSSKYVVILALMPTTIFLQQAHLKFIKFFSMNRKMTIPKRNILEILQAVENLCKEHLYASKWILQILPSNSSASQLIWINDECCCNGYEMSNANILNIFL